MGKTPKRVREHIEEQAKESAAEHGRQGEYDSGATFEDQNKLDDRLGRRATPEEYDAFEAAIRVELGSDS